MTSVHPLDGRPVAGPTGFWMLRKRFLRSPVLEVYEHVEIDDYDWRRCYSETRLIARWRRATPMEEYAINHYTKIDRVAGKVEFCNVLVNRKVTS